MAASATAISESRSGSMAPMTRMPCIVTTRYRARSRASRLPGSYPSAWASAITWASASSGEAVVERT